MTNTTNTIAEKMTNKKALNYVLDNYDLPAEVAEKLEGMIAQLEKRATAERKPSARQLENGALKQSILDAMEVNRLYSVGEMIKEFTFFPTDITPQRVSALMSQLVVDRKVIREVDKRKVYFKVVAE